ncbi:hypothetical protein [Pseudonocardia hierapolitana]|uniref:hypothetical protein n=1 Tax=Pseudonocardia hierapolitana TaxID=1128676 RepID=UPI0011BE76FD|nr:hypothetical protein [Pseudonocardia hierapolitana]
MATPPKNPRPDDGRPPSWAGAPGFTPGVDGLPPHAPMPGAPPYPAAPEHAPPPVGRRARRTRFVTALGATAFWAVVNVVLVVAVVGVPPGPAAFGQFVGVLILPTLLAALAVWAIARRRAWPFWLLVLLAAPFFWVLRAVFNALPAS